MSYERDLYYCSSSVNGRVAIFCSPQEEMKKILCGVPELWQNVSSQ